MAPPVPKLWSLPRSRRRQAETARFRDWTLPALWVPARGARQTPRLAEIIGPDARWARPRAPARQRTLLQSPTPALRPLGPRSLPASAEGARARARQCCGPLTARPRLGRRKGAGAHGAASARGAGKGAGGQSAGRSTRPPQHVRLPTSHRRFLRPRQEGAPGRQQKNSGAGEHGADSMQGTNALPRGSERACRPRKRGTLGRWQGSRDQAPQRTAARQGASALTRDGILFRRPRKRGTPGRWQGSRTRSPQKTDSSRLRPGHCVA